MWKSPLNKLLNTIVSALLLILLLWSAPIWIPWLLHLVLRSLWAFLWPW